VAAPERLSKDHVLPQHLLAREVTYAQNFRASCVRCNQLRARLGHCCGALMLAVVEAEKRRVSIESAVSLLGMGYFPIDAAGQLRLRHLRYLDRATKRLLKRIVLTCGAAHPDALRAAALREAYGDLRRSADTVDRARLDAAYAAVQRLARGWIAWRRAAHGDQETLGV